MNLRILIIEDDQNRIEQFKARARETGDRYGIEVTLGIVDHERAVCDILWADHGLHMVSFDHDLDANHMDLPPGAPGTGGAIADRIARNRGKFNLPRRVYTHSAVDGKRAYIAAKIGAIETPGLWLHEEWHRVVQDAVNDLIFPPDTGLIM